MTSSYVCPTWWISFESFIDQISLEDDSTCWFFFKTDTIYFTIKTEDQSLRKFLKIKILDYRNRIGNILTCSEVAIEPWHVSSRTLLGSPRRGWALIWSLKQLMSSQPVMNTNTAPGRSFRHMWHKTASIRLNPMQSGVQHDSESRTPEL